jgi:hypothetical protein
MHKRVALYNAINSKRETYCTTQGYNSPPKYLLPLAKSMPLPKSDSGLLHLEKVVGVRDKFDNSVSNTTSHKVVYKRVQFRNLKFSKLT